MKQIHQVAWKFGTQNLVTTCTLTLKQNLEHFSKYILSKLYYIILKLWKSGIQHFKQCVNWSWNEEVKTIWDNCAKLKDHFEMISKFNLWIWNPIRNWGNFELDFEFISWISKSFRNGPSNMHNYLQIIITFSFQLWFSHCLKYWIPDF